MSLHVRRLTRSSYKSSLRKSSHFNLKSLHLTLDLLPQWRKIQLLRSADKENLRERTLNWFFFSFNVMLFSNNRNKIDQKHRDEVSCARNVI